MKPYFRIKTKVKNHLISTIKWDFDINSTGNAETMIFQEDTWSEIYCKQYKNPTIPKLKQEHNIIVNKFKNGELDIE